MNQAKWSKIAAVFATATLLLTACGPGNDNTSNTQSTTTGTKTLLVWEDVKKSDGIKDAVKEFEKSHDVKIKVVEKAYADQLEALRLDGAAGIGPDVITTPHDQIGTAVTEGLLQELKPAQKVTDTFTKESIQSQTVDGKLYGLPKSVETTVLFYNKDLVKKAPDTLDGWYDLSKSMTKGDKYGFIAKWDEIYYAQSVLGGYGGYIFKQGKDNSYDVKDIGLNNKGAIEGGKYIQKFFKEGLFPKGMIGEQGINVLNSLFTEKKAAAVISGPWSFGPYKEAGIQYGVSELPTLPNGKHMSSFLGVKSYNISSYSKNKELAEQFIEFLTNYDNSKKRFEITEEIPPVKKLMEDPIITENTNASAVSKQTKYATLTPNNPELNEVWKPIDSALRLIATNRTDVKKALDDAVKTIDSQIKANHSK
ncbi:extracellular solute-binding protein [Bacillus sp. NPDC077027]|uniref:extracellular solute-binding protein n=1 Tax=Bacillus sp. NPDC077027 TaxID=3390548 RepID=UPI003D04FF71